MLTELKTAVDDQSAELPRLSRERFKRNLIAELEAAEPPDDNCADSLLFQAELTTDDETLEVQCAPYFLEVNRFRSNIGRFMSEMIVYAQLLEKLAAKELTDIKSVESEADNINAGIGGALKAINPDEENLVDGLVAPITNKVLSHLQASVSNQQIDEINKAIGEGQAGIQENIDHLKRAIRHLAKAYKAEQSEQWQDLQIDLNDPSKRKATVEKAVAYGENRWRVYASMRNLLEAADKIPQAHKALAIKAKPGSSVDRFASFVDFAKDLQSAVKTAEKEDKKDVLQSEADKADALADLAESEARQAQLAADKLRVEWTSAVVKANESGRNSDRQAAAALESDLNELLAVAKQKLDNAAMLRGAAIQLQETVDALKKEIDE